MKRAVWLLLICLPLALRASECDDNNVYIVEVVQGTNRLLIAKAEHCLYATITLTVSLDNVVSAQHFPLTVDLNGTNSLVLATLHQDKPQRPWHYHYKFTYKKGGRSSANSSDHVYALPYHGEKHTIAQGYFGDFSHQRGSSEEYAIDFDMPVGTPVCAAREGIVAAIRQDSDSGGDQEKYLGCANYVIIKHDDGTYAEYFHLKKNSVAVALGKSVAAGQQIALSGNTGFSSEPHLHMAVYRNIDGNTRITMPVEYRLPDGTTAALQQGKTY